MKKRAILLLAAFTATVVIAIAAVRWKDLAVRYQVFRLSGNPQLQDAWLERPADSIQGRAVRTYFRERPGELIRGFLRTMRFVCDQKEVDRRPPHLKDFEGQDRITIALWKSKAEEKKWVFVELGFESKDGGGGTFDFVIFDDDDRRRVPALEPLSELLKVADGGRAEALAESPGWSFNTFFHEFEAGFSSGIRGQYGGWTRTGDDIGMRETVWTGREILRLGWPNGAALDPLSGKWRAIRGNPRCTPGGLPLRVLRWDDRRILVASSRTSATIAFDLYRIDQDAWEMIGETSPELFDQPGERGKDVVLEVLGGTALGEEALVFVQSTHPGSPVRGIRIDPSGRLSPIPVLNASRDAFSDEVAIHSFGSKVFLWSSARSSANRKNWGAIWDGDADRWEQLPEGGLGSEPRYSFSHLKTADEVVILGGSKHAIAGVEEDPENDAIAFSLKERCWRRVPVPPAGRWKTNPAVGWTGKEAWVWEGGRNPGLNDPSQPVEKPEPGSAGLFDLATGAWKPFPPGGPSPRTSPWSAWTGKEILFLGGGWYAGPYRYRFYRDVWAFNPSTSVWRRLDNIPRSRQECAGVALPVGEKRP